MFFEKFSSEKNRIWRVTELNLSIKQLLEGNVPLLWVRGEVSNLVKAASGHAYFSLKEESSQVRCVMFRHKSKLSNYSFSNGQAVEVLAAATLYEQRGDFQLIIEQMRPAGQGVLFERFEQLKQLLASQGLFANERKQALPNFPNSVGVITSPQAAALRDVLATLRQRLPSISVVLYPTPVQGVGSAEKIAAAIKIANQRKECEVLIVCRGGGSIEDLWAFNEESVARAIAASDIPIISGVGHETDFTIADFVADERAATPTAAAQAVVPDRCALLSILSSNAQHLARAQDKRLQNVAQQLDFFQRRLVHPNQQLVQQKQHLLQLKNRLYRVQAQYNNNQVLYLKDMLKRFKSVGKTLVQQRDKHVNLVERLLRAMQSTQSKRLIQFENIGQQLAILNPQRVLERGYSLVKDEQGEIVSDPTKLSLGAELNITFAHGRAIAELKDKG